MDDLVSKSAIIALIERHKGEVKSPVPIIQETYEIAHDHISELINILPAAYDVEKVAKELDDYLFDKYCIEGDSKIYDIVKNGGKEEVK